MGTRGPAPDPHAIRRDRPSDQATWVTLPDRRHGPTPPWPFGYEPSEGSLRADLWRELWTMPQAVMWERHRRHIEVAHYVDVLVSIESGPPEGVKVDPTVQLRSIALRQQDSLGLTSGALNRLRWRIGDAATTKGAPIRDGRSATSARARLALIAGREATG